MTVFLTVFQPSYFDNLLVLLSFRPNRDCWRPSQPPGSLAEVPRHSENRRHFSRLAARSPVSGEGYRTSRAKSREFKGESLLDEFLISEIQERRGRETGCVLAETGSNQRLHAAVVRKVATRRWPAFSGLRERLGPSENEVRAWLGRATSR
jgi:hypothetical protein